MRQETACGATWTQVARQTDVHDMATDEEIEALLRAADEADAAARATLPNAAQVRATIDAAEALAGSEAGVPAKSRAS